MSNKAAAGSQSASPAWLATTVQLPAAIRVNVPPSATQTAGVVLANATGSPEPARAASGKWPAASDPSVGIAKSIACSARATTPAASAPAVLPSASRTLTVKLNAPPCAGTPETVPVAASSVRMAPPTGDEIATVSRSSEMARPPT